MVGRFSIVIVTCVITPMREVKFSLNVDSHVLPVKGIIMSDIRTRAQNGYFEREKMEPQPINFINLVGFLPAIEKPPINTENVVRVPAILPLLPSRDQGAPAKIMSNALGEFGESVISSVGAATIVTGVFLWYVDSRLHTNLRGQALRILFRDIPHYGCRATGWLVRRFNQHPHYATKSWGRYGGEKAGDTISGAVNACRNVYGYFKDKALPAMSQYYDDAGKMAASGRATVEAWLKKK